MKFFCIPILFVYAELDITLKIIHFSDFSAQQICFKYIASPNIYTSIENLNFRTFFNIKINLNYITFSNDFKIFTRYKCKHRRKLFRKTVLLVMTMEELIQISMNKIASKYKCLLTT